MSKPKLKYQSYRVSKKIQSGEDKQIREAFVLSGNDQFEVNTLQHHLGKNSGSTLLIKAVLFDNSRFDFQGKIKIEKGAQDADAYQRIAILLMSERAKAKVEPFLEIETNEVRCTHGASIGRINEEQLFYLQSRGLDHPRAERLLVEAFLEEAINKIADPKKQSQVRKNVLLKLNKVYA